MMAWVRLWILVGVLAVAIGSPSAAQLPLMSAETLEETLEAAERNDADAQFDLGRHYYNISVREFYFNPAGSDYREALHWYRKAADQGHANAQWRLADIYFAGKGVTRDYEEAVHWYRKVADQGHADAQYTLASLYDNGEGVTRDYEEAARWYRKAADQGHASAQFYLGFFYDNGKGVSRDYVEAYKWYILAAAQTSKSNYSFRKALDGLEAKLTPEQIAEGQRLAREWQPSEEN